MFSLLTEDTENYAFSDQQMQRIEENFLLRSVDELPEISQKTIKEIEEPDPFVRTLLEEPDTYELWNSVDRQKKTYVYGWFFCVCFSWIYAEIQGNGGCRKIQL